MSDFLKKLAWQEWVLLAAMVIVCFSQYSQISQFSQVPSPIYGGDLYYHYGKVLDYYRGGSFFEESHIAGEYSSYPGFFHFLISSLSKFLGMQPFNVFIFFPLIITIASGIVFYILMFKITNNKTAALLTALLWMAIDIPSSHPTPFSAKVIIPLFLLSLIYASSWKTRILAGVAYGLCGITHVTAFLGASLIIILFFIYKIIEKEKKEHKINYSRRIKEQIIAFLPIVVIGVLIAMLYWWAPIFVYHGETPNNWQEYSSGSPLSISYLITTFARYLFNTSGFLVFAISLISLAGLYFSIKYNKKFSFFLIVLAAAIIGILHPILTVPLLGTSFGFYRFPNILLYPVSAMFFGVAVLLILNSLKAKKAKNLAAIIIGAVIIINFFFVYDAYSNNQWTNAGKNQDAVSSIFIPFGKEIMASTGVNDVFIAPHEETAFALHSITGGKVLFMRRTHASPFVDINKRVADGAVILYGNDSSKINELISEYGIKYFYVDAYAISSIIGCIKSWDAMDLPQNGEMSYSCLRTSSEYGEYLKKYGVQTKKVSARLNPASDKAEKFDLLAIKPANFSEAFSKRLSEVKAIRDQANQTVVGWYRVN